MGIEPRPFIQRSPWPSLAKFKIACSSLGDPWILRTTGDSGIGPVDESKTVALRVNDTFPVNATSSTVEVVSVLTGTLLGKFLSKANISQEQDEWMSQEVWAPKIIMHFLATGHWPLCKAVVFKRRATDTAVIRLNLTKQDLDLINSQQIET